MLWKCPEEKSLFHSLFSLGFCLVGFYVVWFCGAFFPLDFFLGI